MNKKNQFITSAIVAGVGLILLGISRLSISASTLVSYGGNFTIITIIGLGLMIIAAIWFYILSVR